MIRVAIVDDHPMILEGLTTMLDVEESIEITECYTNAKDFRNEMDTIKADVVLLDIQLEDGNGMELCKELNKIHPKMGIIAITNYDDTSFVKGMIRNGAKGYVLKNISKKELLIALESVNLGEQYIQKKLQQKMVNDSLGLTKRSRFLPKLTRREKEILQLIVEELTTSEIAEKLFLSPKTVETHRSHLIQKLGVRNTAGLVKMAIEKGLLKD